ncbi:peptidylprolyl isomerase [Leptolyngbya sp. 7M]|uniref:peptidylprolyl isomerase n=1 Tax=Leptolyngbya sp. 7M TaxID=2812896 RepID=UPI001B8C6EFD|nr:peptidylprolyl isomerase [Leptolyngbya sp. 7M]QYO66323.1 peptidylprolyl isomerase [Leptolyngbya sp. 7M]
MANRTAVIETNKGTIRFELLEQDAPKTTENFRLLAGKNYYDGVIFHRVIPNFMIQGGDPLGEGYGGESAWGGRFDDEIDRGSDLYAGAYEKGTVAMANSGPNTNGSQFFIMHVDYPLPPSYTKFGRVLDGHDVVDAIANVERNAKDKPLEPVVMNRVYIEEAAN